MSEPLEFLVRHGYLLLFGVVLGEQLGLPLVGAPVLLAAGALAAFCLDRGLSPRAVRNTPDRLREFQSALVAQGVEIHWPRARPR